MWCQFSCSPNSTVHFKVFSSRAKAGRWNLWQWKLSAQIFSRSLATQHKYHGGSFVKRAGGTTKRWNMRQSGGKEEIGAPLSPPLETTLPLCQTFEDHVTQCIGSPFHDQHRLFCSSQPWGQQESDARNVLHPRPRPLPSQQGDRHHHHHPRQHHPHYHHHHQWQWQQKSIFLVWRYPFQP